MTGATCVNSLGLIFDIAGAALLFYFGLPAEVSRDGAFRLIPNQPNPDEVAKARRYDWWARVGLVALVLGFALQLGSNFMK